MATLSPMRLSGLIPIFLLSVNGGYSVNANPQNDRSYDRVESQYLADIRETLPGDNVDIEAWEKVMSVDAGVFSDLDYQSTIANQWGPLIHLERMVWMCLAHQNPEHRFFRQPRFLEFVAKSIRMWGQKRFRHQNWWHNEIGVPLRTTKLYFLLKSKIDPKFLSVLVEISKQTDQRSARSGQNLIWYSELTIALGIAQKDSARMDRGREDIESVLVHSSEEGIKPDGSFWQHGKVFYPAGYGAEFSKDVSRLVRILGNTDFSLSPDRVKVLEDYVIDGQAWLVRGNKYNFSAAGRYFARPGFNAKTLQIACQNLATLKNRRMREYQACAEGIRTGAPTSRQGNRFFWEGDFMVQQASTFSASVKMLSSRLLNNDTTPLKEGLLNDYLSDGVTYLTRTGNEYEDIAPIWDYTKLPGITATDEPLEERYDVRLFGLKSFVGGVSDGTSGLAAMDFLRGKVIPSSHWTIPASMDRDASELRAKKSYFFSPRGLVVLTADLSRKGREHRNVTTTLNQTWARSAVTYQIEHAGSQKLVGGTPSRLMAGTHRESIRWLHHDHLTYVMFAPRMVHFQVVEQTGSWRRVNAQASNAPVKGQVMTAWIDHGTTPNQESFAYAVIPGAAADAPKIASELPVRILQNNANIQAIEDTESGLVQASFFEAGRVKSSRFEVAVDRPVLVQVSTIKGHGSLSVSSPDRSVKRVNVEFRGQSFQVDLPQGNRSGSTVTIDLPTYANLEL